MMPLNETSIAAIRHLDKVTGAGLVICRAAWDESNGDLDRAEAIALELARNKISNEIIDRIIKERP